MYAGNTQCGKLALSQLPDRGEEGLCDQEASLMSESQVYGRGIRQKGSMTVQYGEHGVKVKEGHEDWKSFHLLNQP